jgi:hypothetical protein
MPHSSALLKIRIRRQRDRIATDSVLPFNHVGNVAVGSDAEPNA